MSHLSDHLTLSGAASGRTASNLVLVNQGQSPIISFTLKDIAGRSRPPALTHGQVKLLTLPNIFFLVGKRVCVVQHYFYIYFYLLFPRLG